MPNHHLALLAATAAVLFPLTVCAQTVAMSHHTDPGRIVTMADWSQRMQTELINGMVRITFGCSENGRPTSISLLKSSGVASVDRAAMRVVGKMASLHPLPTGFTPATRYEALILFASDSRDLRLAANQAERIKRNDWYHDPLTVAASAPAQIADR